MHKTIVTSKYSAKNILVTGFGAAAMCTILFYLLFILAGPASSSKTGLATLWKAAQLSVMVFVNLVLRLTSLRHTRTFRFDGYHFLIWGGRMTPFLDILQLLLCLAGAFGFLAFVTYGSVIGLVLLLINICFFVGFEEYCRLMRFKLAVKISEIVSVKPIRSSKETVLAKLKSGASVCLARVPEIESVGGPASE